MARVPLAIDQAKISRYVLNVESVGLTPEQFFRPDGRGVVFNSNTGFVLPNGATRSPDESWIQPSRWDALAAQQQSVFSPICPYFVIELWSPGDVFNEIQFKLEEYVANGAKLGFLIYPPDRQVYVYRPDRPPQRIDNPQSISGDPELPCFTMGLTRIWQ